MGSVVQWHFIPCVPWRTISDDLSWYSLVRVVQNCRSIPSSQPEHISWTVHEIKNHPTKDNRHWVFKIIVSNSSESIFSLKCVVKCSGWFLLFQKYLLSSECLQVWRQPMTVQREGQAGRNVCHACLSPELFMGSVTLPSGPMVPPAGHSGIGQTLYLTLTDVLFLQGNQDQRSFINLFHLS